MTASNKMYVGDSVTFGDGTSGKVIKQGWMETVLRQSNNIMTSVPNSILSGQKISNLSRQKQSQVKQTLRFNYDDAEQIPLLLDSIKSEIKKACPRLISDGTRPFRVFWTGYQEDHLEVMVDTHHNIAPIGDAYWQNRQNILLAISRAVKKHDIDFVQLYTQAGAPAERRVVPKATLASTAAQQEEVSAQMDDAASDVDALKSKAKE
jgi:small-conductance mechanosensitive channel